ncbi:MAG: hypothetical protein QXJ06_00145 [Candidatus Aenigmatarchaeota archaeon]
MNENYLLFSIIFLAILLAITAVSFGQQEYSSIMNVSISQPICIQLSGNYSTGILFTNTTNKGTQVNITYMTGLNNATANYLAASDGTAYYIQACAGNTIDVKAAHCACEDLICKSGDCIVGTDKLYVTYGPGGGVGWANGTTATFNVHSPPDTTNYYFQSLDSYQIIAGNITPGGYIYMRYWIDPRPDNAPSGVYNNTFRVRAVEINSNFGTCSC